jgi:hypothetical protein
MQFTLKDVYNKKHTLSEIHKEMLYALLSDRKYVRDTTKQAIYRVIFSDNFPNNLKDKTFFSKVYFTNGSGNNFGRTTIGDGAGVLGSEQDLKNIAKQFK